MILLGLSHAGKTSVGRLLAERLSCRFYDTDALIRIRTGLTPRELCRQGGVSALHAAEAAVLRECCGLNCAGAVPLLGTAAVPLAENLSAITAENFAVIAAGGGICENAEAFPLIAAIPLRVFLYASEAALFERLTRDALHTGYYPAFLHFLPVDQKAEAQRLFAELYTRRTELYRKSCNLIIDTTGLDCAAVAEKIAEQSGN